MSTQTLTLQHKLPNDFQIIYNSLLDLKKFGELHPHMTGVDIIANASPEFVEYHIVEEVYFFGFIKNHPVYDAKVVEVKKDEHIRYLSQVKKNIYLTVDFTFTKNKNGSLIVNEIIAVTSNKLMAAVFMNILKKAHLKFFSNLNTFLLNSVEDVANN
jgi:hypothetical protein